MVTELNKQVEYLHTKPLPIFQQTADSLRDAGNSIGNGRNSLKSLLYFDPGAVLHLLKLTSGLQRRKLAYPVADPYDSIMLLGVQRAKAVPDELEVLALPAEQMNLKGYMSVVARSYLAASIAYEWSVYLAQPEPVKIFVATLLHAVGEMYLWLYGNDEMRQIYTLMYEKGMPADEAQYVVLGYSLDQLSHALCERWNMPPLLCASLDAEESEDTRVMQVKLASQIGRLSEHGWYHDDMEKCIEEAGEQLHFSCEDTARRIHRVALGVARETEHYAVLPAAARLPMLPGVVRSEFVLESAAEPVQETEEATQVCLMPQLKVYNNVLTELTERIKSGINMHDVMLLVMEGLHDGVGLNRVIFAMLNQDRTELKTRFHSGTDNDSVFSLFHFNVEQPHLFSMMMKKPISIWLGDHNRDKLWQHVPEKVRDQIGTDSFYAMSVFGRNKPVGMIYADRHLHESHLDELSYERFKKLCSLAAQGVEASYR